MAGKHTPVPFAVGRTSADPATAPYRDSEDHEGLMDFSDVRKQRLPFWRALDALRMGPKRRKGYEYEQAPTDDALIGAPKPTALAPARRSCLAKWTKRILIDLPMLVMMLFGLLHILNAAMSRAHLFWNADYLDIYLADWGKIGHPGAGLSSYPTDATRDVIPIACHSHNDYWRRIPLFDALSWGCTGVEADVWAIDDELYVGHNLAALAKNRTFRSLYVDPLVELLDKMNPKTEFTNATGHGVFDEDPSQTLVLLVDFKTGGRLTYPLVYDQLDALRQGGYLTYWDGKEVHSRAVTVVGTGNTPFDMVTANGTYRDIFFDAPLHRMGDAQHDDHDDDLESLGPDSEHHSRQGETGINTVDSADAFDTTNSYYASTSFLSTVGWVWRGRLSGRQMDIIRSQVRGAQERGLKVRYWDTPAWPVSLRNHVWDVLVKEGADMLNVDDLKGAATSDWRRKTGHTFW